MLADASVSAENRGNRGRGMIRSAAKVTLRKALAAGLYWTGLLRSVERLAGSRDLRRDGPSRFPRLRISSSSKFGILCYHRVGTDGVPLHSRMEPELFEAQIDYVRKHYRIVSLEQLLQEMKDAAPVPPTLAITFDDGYRDLYTYAFPVLNEYSIPATIYLISRCMETGEVPWYDRIFTAVEAVPGTVFEIALGDGQRRYSLRSSAERIWAAWDIVCYLRSIPDVQRQGLCLEVEKRVNVPEEPLRDRMLTWEQVRAMQRTGISFGAHTQSHPAVSKLQPSAFREEFVRSRESLERGLDATVSDFAYPFGKPGDCSLATESFLEQSGYRSAVTTSEGYNTWRSNPFRLLRFQVEDQQPLSEFALELCRLFLQGCADQAGAVFAPEYEEMFAATEARTAAR